MGDGSPLLGEQWQMNRLCWQWLCIVNRIQWNTHKKMQDYSNLLLKNLGAFRGQNKMLLSSFGDYVER